MFDRRGVQRPGPSTELKDPEKAHTPRTWASWKKKDRSKFSAPNRKSQRVQFTDLVRKVSFCLGNSNVNECLTRTARIGFATPILISQWASPSVFVNKRFCSQKVSELFRCELGWQQFKITIMKHQAAECATWIFLFSACLYLYWVFQSV